MVISALQPSSTFAITLLVLVAIGMVAAAAAQQTIPAPDDVAAPPADAETTASGLASKVIEAGSGGQNPGPASTVTVHYTGWLTNGEMFDSSVARGAPASFP